MDRAAHAMITSGVTTVFHPLVYAKTLIQVRSIIEISAYEESHLLLVTCSPGSVLVLSAKPLLTKHSTASLCKHTIRICRGMSRTVYK